MASFRNHRIVIASLFLPTTAVLGESPPITPEHHLHPVADSGPESTIPAVTQRLTTALADGLANRGSLKPSLVLNAHSRQHSQSVPFKSLVDDLKDKASF